MTNSDLIQAAFHAVESPQPASADSYFSDDFTWIGSLPRPLNKAQFIGLMAASKKGFPDFTLGLKVVDETSDAVVRCTCDPVGTHEGVFLLPGLPPIPPTGRILAMPRQVLLFTLKAGKIQQIKVEAASGGCLADFLEQLGVELDEQLLNQLFQNPR